MFITKTKLSRRAVLQGVGAALGLPLLEAMIPALTPVVKTAGNPVKRFGAIFVPLGERPGYWTPKTVGSNFEFSPILKPLEPFRNSITVVFDRPAPAVVSKWQLAVQHDIAHVITMPHVTKAHIDRLVEDVGGTHS